MNFDKFNSFKKDIDISANEQELSEGIGFDNKQSNPIIPSGLISKINSINSRTTANRLYAGYNNKNWRNFENIDYQEVIKFINEVTGNIFIIPMHYEIAKGTLRSILEQADIELEEFLKNL